MKIVTVLNPNYPVPALLNAVGHTAIAIGGSLSPAGLALRNYQDAEATALGSLSDHSLIVLKVKRLSHLKRLIDAANAHPAITHSVFVDYHRNGTPADQVEAVSAAIASPDKILAVTLFGETEDLEQLTKRFSLF